MKRERFINTLLRHEGVRVLAYDDATGQELRPGDTLQGNVTIGVGRNLSGRGLTAAESMHLLENDIREVAMSLESLPAAAGLNDVRREVLGNMIFNMGFQGLVSFKKMLAFLESRDFHGAADEMLDSRWARQVGPRAKELADAMRSGSF